MRYVIYGKVNRVERSYLFHDKYGYSYKIDIKNENGYEIVDKLLCLNDKVFLPELKWFYRETCEGYKKIKTIESKREFFTGDLFLFKQGKYICECLYDVEKEENCIYLDYVAEIKQNNLTKEEEQYLSDKIDRINKRVKSIRDMYKEKKVDSKELSYNSSTFNKVKNNLQKFIDLIKHR